MGTRTIIGPDQSASHPYADHRGIGFVRIESEDVPDVGTWPWKDACVGSEANAAGVLYVRKSTGWEALT